MIKVIYNGRISRSKSETTQKEDLQTMQSQKPMDGNQMP